MKAIFKLGLGFAALLTTSAAANATVTITTVRYEDAATLSAGENLVTDFGTSQPPNAAIVPIYLPGYTFTWTDDYGNPGGTSVVNSNATGVYSNTSLISGISAPPPGDTPDYFTVVGPAGQATLKAPKALTSLSMLWGSMDTYNQISFIGKSPADSYSFSGFQVYPPADGNQSADDTNREVLFTFNPGDEIKKVVFGSSQNSFEFDNLAVTAVVPEPATWALFLVGFGGIGALMRLKDREPRAAAATA